MRAAYSIAFPDLGGVAADNYAGGSRVWHGDLGNEDAELICDEILGFGDVDPFLERISEGCCWDECDVCPGDSYSLSAEQLATQLRAHVPSNRYALLSDLAAAVADYYQDRDNAPRRAFWQQVLAYLDN